ncbi:hypothetical protein RJ640_003923 [Escallonia rubra]|uniref:Uncharacterized protein n=1 Tax=Escallonia rubra TaxID=112253 RepID=A0AA88R831_9ASTE|nr:hypothetical protein RJ640_003923 [Escallonia rubra]
MLMGSKRSWFIICLTLYISLSHFVQGSAMNNYYNPDLLDDFVHEYAQKSLLRHRTGTLYNVSLPGNFSGMEASTVRVRSGSFWNRGANFSFFHIPSRAMPMPFVKRVDIVYQNLGNWSSRYYVVPNYTLVTPVVGFLIYDALNSSENGVGMVNLSVTGDPILVRFPQISLPGEERNATRQCVRFDQNGTVEFSDMTMPNLCVTRGQGHFSIVVPTTSKKRKKRERLWKWWVIGFGVGVVGLVLLGLVVVLIRKLIRVKRIAKMERQSEKSEVLDTVWIGESRMPSASGIRTQPVLENDYHP